MNGFETFVPGMLLALAPAVVSLAVQGVVSSRRERAAARAAIRAAGLELIDRAHGIAFLLPFTQAHSDGATRPAMIPSLLLGLYEPFSIQGMGDQYSQRFNSLFTAAAALRASGDATLAHHADEIVRTTTRLFEAYLHVDDTRSRWQRLSTPRALDAQTARAAAEEQANAISALEAALARP